MWGPRSFRYTSGDGTSFSTPLVAGEAALLKAQNPAVQCQPSSASCQVPGTQRRPGGTSCGLRAQFAAGRRTGGGTPRPRSRAMSADLNRLESIFAAAIRQPSAEARIAYLDQACAGDLPLRQRLDGLLAAHDAASNFLQAPTIPGPGAEGRGLVGR